MRFIKIKQVDSFSPSLFGGNPAGVVMNSELLTEPEMKEIAREMNLSETAFIFPSHSYDLKLKFITPSKHEIDFCGHATIGALAALLDEDKYASLDQRMTLTAETNIGLMKLYIDPRKKLFGFDTPKVDFVASPWDHRQIAEALGIKLNFIDHKKPIWFERTNRCVYFTMSSFEALRDMDVDFKSTALFGKKEGIVLFAATFPKGFSSESHASVRGFAPAVGVPEDPFTGSIQGGLTAYLYRLGMLPSGQSTFRFEQGHFIGRPGRAAIDIKNWEPFHAELKAEARLVFSTELKLD